MSDDITHGLGPAGTELVSKIIKEMAVDKIMPDSREAALLRTAGELRDRMADLEAAIAEDGLRRETKAGTIQLHPAAGELRQHSVALARVLGGISLADTHTPKSARHQRAAAVRWAREG